jgi:Putative zinc-finger
MTCPETIRIGAYVLGALDAAERRTTEQHLVTCATCREALLQFAPIPGILNAVPIEDLEPAPVRRRPVRRRWLLAAAAAVILGGVLGWQALDNPDSTTWTATNGLDGIDTTARLTSHGWGTDIQLRLTDLKPGEHCMLIVHGRDGTVETAGWWATPTSYQADVPASTSIPLHDIDRLEVVTAGDTVLSTVSPSTR